VEADTRLRASAWEFGRRILHRGYVVFIGIVGGLLGTFNEFFGGAIKLPPWASWALFGSSLLIAAVWAFHDLRAESLKRVAELERDGLKASAIGVLDGRYQALSDLIGGSLTTGLELSKDGDWKLRDAWEGHTRAIVACAYGDGEAAHVFTPELGEAKVYRGLDMIKAPPPLADKINRVREFLGRMTTLTIRPEFTPEAWRVFDPPAYRAEYALKIRMIGDEGKSSCPWCGLETDKHPTQCGGCNAEFEGDWAYKAGSPLRQNLSI
jgi:hypothetical protein